MTALGNRVRLGNSVRTWPDLVLPSDVPDVHVQVLVGHVLDVEAYGRDGRDEISELQLVQNRRLPGGIESEHDHPGVLGERERVEHFGHEETPATRVQPGVQRRQGEECALTTLRVRQAGRQ